MRGEHFDVVVDWLAFSPRDVEADITLFSGSISQYVSISSATVYRKWSPCFPLVEDAPLGNERWQYAREKIACEEMTAPASTTAPASPVTIDRPSLHLRREVDSDCTDGQDFTIVDRMRSVTKVIVPGDGTSLWTMTHHTDFAPSVRGDRSATKPRSARRSTSPRTRC